MFVRLHQDLLRQVSRPEVHRQPLLQPQLHSMSLFLDIIRAEVPVQCRPILIYLILCNLTVACLCRMAMANSRPYTIMPIRNSHSNIRHSSSSNHLKRPAILLKVTTLTSQSSHHTPTTIRPTRTLLRVRTKQFPFFTILTI